MRVVGVKQLKAKLSEYLRDVRRGEAFLVTDRDQVVAELRPPGTSSVPTRDAPEHALEQTLEQLALEGLVTAPRQSKDAWAWHPVGAGLSSGTAARLLDDLREER